MWQPRTHQSIRPFMSVKKSDTIYFAPPHAAQTKHTQTLSILRQSTNAFLWKVACHIAQTLSPFKRALEVLSVSTDYTCCHAISAFHQEVKCKTAAIEIFKNVFWAEAVLTKRRDDCEVGKTGASDCCSVLWGPALLWHSVNKILFYLNTRTRLKVMWDMVTWLQGYSFKYS